MSFRSDYLEACGRSNDLEARTDILHELRVDSICSDSERTLTVGDHPVLIMHAAASEVSGGFAEVPNGRPAPGEIPAPHIYASPNGFVRAAPEGYELRQDEGDDTPSRTLVTHPGVIEMYAGTTPLGWGANHGVTLSKLESSVVAGVRGAARMFDRSFRFIATLDGVNGETLSLPSRRRADEMFAGSRIAPLGATLEVEADSEPIEFRSEAEPIISGLIGGCGTTFNSINDGEWSSSDTFRRYS